MITKEMIKKEIDKLPVELLKPVYQFILDEEKTQKKRDVKIKNDTLLQSKGVFSKYKNSMKINSEKSAWGDVVREKHADY